MLNGKRVIAIIPARGGSKSVPRKNIRLLAGKPLIAWSIEIAKQVEEIDRVIVSTDDAEIADIGRQYTAEVYPRPATLATDQALVIDVLKDLVSTLQAERESAEILLLLEPTCPFRNAEDVRGCLQLLVNGECDSAATFTDAELHPHRAWKINGHTPEVFIPEAIPWLPRQQLPQAYQLNGAVYAVRIAGLFASQRSLLFGRVGSLKMPRLRSIDINDPIDLAVAEHIASLASLE
jgi:CMP-N,N'-diacetyllegionaminic acid synthase